MRLPSGQHHNGESNAADGFRDDPPPARYTLPLRVQQQWSHHAPVGGWLRGPGSPLRPASHGFPELAYSWRKVLLPLAAAGFHVVALTSGVTGVPRAWDGNSRWRPPCFLHAQPGPGYPGAGLGVGLPERSGRWGHDFGSPVAAWCALIRPDVFRAVVLDECPVCLPPAFFFDTAHEGTQGRRTAVRHRQPWRTFVTPWPPSNARVKHYQWYYSTREADANMRYCLRRASMPSCAPTILMEECRLAARTPFPTADVER